VIGIKVGRVVGLVLVVDVAGRLRTLEEDEGRRLLLVVVVAAGFVDVADPELSVRDFSGAPDNGSALHQKHRYNKDLKPLLPVFFTSEKWFCRYEDKLFCC